MKPLGTVFITVRSTLFLFTFDGNGSSIPLVNNLYKDLTLMKKHGFQKTET
jgi:hypothetical protein